MQKTFERPRYFGELYAASGAEALGLGFDEFCVVLTDVSARYLPVSAKPSETEAFHRGLHIEDLALARACASGSEAAWDCFLSRYRQKLYDIAGSIAHEEAVARELADSIYGELFGASKLASYTGRGSLAGWLRTVVAQRYVDQYRSTRRLVSLDEQIHSPRQFHGDSNSIGSLADPRLEQATDAALLELSAEERLILAAYYLDGRTLAEVARIVGVHESTISRRIDKITKSVRKRILRGLRQRGMSARAAEEALEVDVRDVALDIRGRLLQERSE